MQGTQEGVDWRSKGGPDLAFMPAWKRAVAASHVKRNLKEEAASQNVDSTTADEGLTGDNSDSDSDGDEATANNEGALGNDEEPAGSEESGNENPSESRRNVNVRAVRKKRVSKAVYADLVLYFSQVRLAQTAIMEIKTFWACPKWIFQKIFSDALTNDKTGNRKCGLPRNDSLQGAGGGYFDWRLKTDEGKLIKQASIQIQQITSWSILTSHLDMGRACVLRC